MAKKFKKSIYQESWYQRAWRPAMAFLYLFLCLLDYGIRPAVNYQLYKSFNLAQTVAAIAPLQPTVQIEIIDSLRKDEPIPPILTEFVHLAFGAILGAAAFTRGQEKTERIKQSGAYDITPPNKPGPADPNNPDPNKPDPTADDAKKLEDKKPDEQPVG